MAELTIGQVARQAGVRTSTLRYYEEIGLLSNPKRVHGHRRYAEDVLQQLGIIQTAQQAGFTLTEIRILLNEILPSTLPQSQWHDLVQRKVEELNKLLAQVLSMKHLLEEVMRCDDPELADCIYVAGQNYKIWQGTK